MGGWTALAPQPPFACTRAGTACGSDQPRLPDPLAWAVTAAGCAVAGPGSAWRRLEAVWPHQQPVRETMLCLSGAGHYLPVSRAWCFRASSIRGPYSAASILNKPQHLKQT